MKRILKNKRVLALGILIGAIVTGTLVYAATIIQASQVTYNNQPLNTVLDDLYTQASARKIVCMKLSGTSLAVGAKYHCDLGENSLRDFYILAVDNNTNEVKLIMEKNITDEILVNNSKMLSWTAANSFFSEGNPGYTIWQTWLTKVISVDLPSAQDIANAAGMNNGTTTNWDVTTATQSDWSYLGVNSTSDTSRRSSYAWLYNYTRGCSSHNCSSQLPDSDGYPYGYWTKDLIQNDPSSAWSVARDGRLRDDTASTSTLHGVRPIIKVYKSNLAG